MLVLIFIFNLSSRQTAFYFAYVFGTSLTMNTFMKLSFEDGRPFMYTSKVFPFVCELEFGNPCDETMNFTAMILAWGLWYYEKLKRQDDDLTDCQRFGIGISVLLSILGIILFSL